jgi:type IV pilus assembly protein PilX
MSRRCITVPRGLTRRIGPIAQRGVSLVFALLALAAMSLAAVALVRSVDSGALIIGNLGFKQDATSAADRAGEIALSWLRETGRDLTTDDAAEGYYATSQEDLDPTGRLTSATKLLAVVNWGEPDSCACLAAGACSSCSRTPSPEISLNGGAVRARYLITRMCPSAGAVSIANACAMPASTGIAQGQGRGEIRVGTQVRPSVAVEVPYFRIIVRTVSGRNTVSFTETVVY